MTSKGIKFEQTDLKRAQKLFTFLVRNPALQYKFWVCGKPSDWVNHVTRGPPNTRSGINEIKVCCRKNYLGNRNGWEAV